ncbi:cytochrome C oxidase, subunit I [Amycolatopsis methanolica 239]|uniref:Cytochrome C oxidase, subunit I n=1 Tax=Amycolatopsis methanolica 239 TaxID=1068978 RepID=A0A076N0K4_AMYME|nr:cytochrome C oxidase, subunit I [Amycolatopsis methanolica 239]
MGRADAWPGRLGLGGATPILFGFANFVLPLQIGAPDVAFPRLNALSYWLFLFGGVITVSGFLTPGGAADFGWFAYTPPSGAIYSPGAGGDLWIAGLTVSGLGTILGAVNMVTTIVCLRAPGMTMFRMPIFTWNVLVTSVMTLIAFPILTAALLGLAADRHLGAHVFDPANGGVILWQHLSQPNSVQSLVTSLDRFRAGPHRVLAGAVAGPQARPSSSPGGCSNRRCRIPGQHRVHGGGDSEDTALPGHVEHRLVVGHVEEPPVGARRRQGLEPGQVVVLAHRADDRVARGQRPLREGAAQTAARTGDQQGSRRGHQ